MKEEEQGGFNVEKTVKTISRENSELTEKFRRLCDLIRGHRSTVIAFSGGVDSSLLAYLSHNLLDKSLSITADSPTLPRSELVDAVEFAKNHKLNHRIIPYNELKDERFKRNDERRCYYCKDGLFKVLNQIKEKEGYDCVFDGSNFDDLGDYRPGREAAKRNNVITPFIEAEVRKKDIRTISKALGLSTWDKPQMACLSSRFPRNVEINEEDLKRIEEAEKIIKGLGYKDVRVRLHGEIARIELGRDEEIDLDKLKIALPKIKELDFKYVSLDLEGYRTGSLNK